MVTMMMVVGGLFLILGILRMVFFATGVGAGAIDASAAGFTSRLMHGRYASPAPTLPPPE